MQKLAFVTTMRPSLGTFYLPLLIVIQVLQCYVYLTVFEWGYLSLAYANVITFLIGFLISSAIMYTVEGNELFRYKIKYMGVSDCWRTFKGYRL